MILVYLGGGLSHHDSFDMKPDAPPEIRGKYKPIATNIAGLHIGHAGTYNIVDNGTITKSGNSYINNIMQTFTGTSGTACAVTYKGTMNK